MRRLSIFIFILTALLVSFAASHWGANNTKEKNPTPRSYTELVAKEDPGKAIHIEQNTFALARTPHLKKYPCMACHTGHETNHPNKEAHQLTHSDIKIQHSQTFKMDCATCHQKNEPDKLTLINGETTHFNRADKLCAQCHFQQKKDWLGGAHGKRVHQWDSKERVIYTCTSCHNPHKPGFDKRWPLLTPKIPRQNEVNK